MVGELREFVKRADLVAVAVGLLIALAAWDLIHTVVGGLIAPFIAVFIGESHFSQNSFRIESVEFPYGYVIEELISFGLALGAVYLLAVRPLNARLGTGAPTGTRECPECTSTIPATAKRCPQCTASIAPAAP